MFETLESRELMSTTLPTVDTTDTTTPTTDAGTPDVTVDARKASSGGSGQIYLVFQFKLVAVKTV
jgi:hypothetical protein